MDGVVEKGGGRFLAAETGFFAEQAAQCLGHAAHGDRLGAGYIEHERRRGAVVEEGEGLGVGVPLPDHIGGAHVEGDGLTLMHVAGDVHQNAVAHFDRIVEADDGAAQPMLARKVVEDALAPQAGHGVFADRRGRLALEGAAGDDRHERIDIAGGKGDDAGIEIALAGQRRQVGVNRPGHVLVAGGAELLTGHVDHVGAVGQGGELRPLQQIAGERLHAPPLQPVARVGLAEAGHAIDAVGRVELIEGAHGHTRQGGAHLAADAEDHQVRVQLLQGGQRCGGGFGEQQVELLLVAGSGGRVFALDAAGRWCGAHGFSLSLTSCLPAVWARSPVTGC